MSSYSVFFKRSARKELSRLDKGLRERIWASVVSLEEGPRPPGCRKVRGASNLWRIRVGEYRVLYSIEDEMLEVEVLAVRHRSDVYR